MKKDNETGLVATNGGQLAMHNQQLPGVLSQEEIEILTQAGVIPKGTPAPQVALFAKVCGESGLSPFRHEICLVAYNDKNSGGQKYCSITEIAGYRKIANRSGAFAGMDEPKFNVRADGSYMTLTEVLEKYGKDGTPYLTCSVTVYKIINGHRVPFTKPVILADFDKKVQQWAWMKLHMICKVAESHSLRAAFSELSGIYTPEEMGAFEGGTYAETEDLKVQITIPEKQLPDDERQALEDIENQLAAFKTPEEVNNFWKANPDWGTKPITAFKAKVQEMCIARGRALKAKTQKKS